MTQANDTLDPNQLVYSLQDSARMLGGMHIETLLRDIRLGRITDGVVKYGRRTFLTKELLQRLASQGMPRLPKSAIHPKNPGSKPGRPRKHPKEVTA